MSVDVLLFTIIISGVWLSIAYLRGQYVIRRSYRIAERENEMHLRELYRPNTRGSLRAPRGQSPVPQRPGYSRTQLPSAAADEGHFRGHEGQKLHICAQRKSRHMDD